MFTQHNRGIRGLSSCRRKQNTVCESVSRSRKGKNTSRSFSMSANFKGTFYFIRENAVVLKMKNIFVSWRKFLTDEKLMTDGFFHRQDLYLLMLGKEKKGRIYSLFNYVQGVLYTRWRPPQ